MVNTASSATAATQLVEATTTGPSVAGVVSTDDAGDAVVVGDESDASSSLPHAASRTPAATSNAVTRRLESVE